MADVHLGDARHMTRATLTLTLVLVGCAGAPAVRSPFQDREVLRRDPDEEPIAMPPRSSTSDLWGNVVHPLLDQADRALTVDVEREAGDANALDEAPDSTWWRRRSLSVDEVRRGPLPEASPRLPLTVLAGRGDPAGASLFTVDAVGVRYQLVLDPADRAGLVSGAGAVVSRLGYALGYNVAAQSVVTLDPERDLVAGADATLRGRYADSPASLSRAALDDLVRNAAREPSTSRLRALAIRELPGTTIGPWSYLGRRADDRNDHVAHEHRRELRGLLPFAAWVNDVAMLDTSTLDAYVGAPGRGHLVHHLTGFESALAAAAIRTGAEWAGDEGHVMPGRVIASTVMFGFGGHRPWMGEAEARRRAADAERWPELGGFGADGFDPSSWSTLWRNAAFARATARDVYWGARQLLRIDRPRLRAAIEAGRYRDAAARRLEEVLWARRGAVLRWGLALVAPLDELRVEGGRLCFTDLWRAAGLPSARPPIYRVRGSLADRDAPGDVRQCVPLPTARGPHLVRLSVWRDGTTRPPPELRVWVADGDHIIGVEREAR